MKTNYLRKSRPLNAASLRQWLIVVALACFGTAWAQTPVAQVSNDGTNWTQFEQLITGNSETGAFDCANTLTGDVVIELLKETDANYTLTSSFTFNKSGMNNLTFRTSATVGQRATLKKDQTSGSMIVISSSTNLTVQDIFFDGNNKNSSGNGGVIRQSQSNKAVTIIDCDFVNCKAQGQGGAVYSNGNVVVQCTQNHSVRFEGCVGSYGGAVCGDKSFTMDNYGTVTFEDCSASNDGGAIRMKTGITINNYGSLSFTNCDSNCGGAMENNNSGATTINNTGTLTIDGCDADSYYYGGGGIAAYRGPLLITNSGTMSITNCTSGYGGGGIAAQNDAITITATAASQVTISNCSSPTKGGGIYVQNSASLSGCTITGCSAPQGGGLYANSNASLTDCTITGCSATTVGGGVYVVSTSLTLGNTVSVTDNTLGNTTVTNGAGIYMANTNGVINIADNGEGANIVVYNNYTSDNQRSDTKTGNTVPPFQITASSLTGMIGVANAGANNSLYLAHSTVSHVCGDPIQNVFVDDAGYYNCNEYYDEEKSIYWGVATVTPICKITDADGYILYRGSNGSASPEAVFPLLDYAFAAYQEVFTHADGTAATPAHIEMIVSDYTQNSALNVPNAALTLKTAGVNPPDGKYPGPTNNAMITRGVVTSSMFILGNSANLSLENLTINGNNETTTTNGGIIRVESSNCHLALNEGTVLKQSLSSSYGGAVYVADNAVFSMSGATIEHCSAKAGGAVYIDGTSGTANTIENSTFSYCNATGTYSYYQNYDIGGGAVRSLKPIAVSSTANKQTLFDHCSAYTGGAILTPSLTLTNYGTISFGDCSATGDGGALRMLYGITINNYNQLSFTNCDSQCGGAMENNNSGAITINNMGTLTIDECDASNSSSYGGGGIAAYGGTLFITNSGTMSITNCTSAFGGGGIYVNNGEATIIGGSTATNQVTISNCSAPKGAGVYSEGASLTLGNTISITGNTIDNTTIDNGAGIYMVNEDGVIIIEDDGAGANITVFGNTTSDNQPSDIKTGKTVMPFEITATSLTGQIGVANTTISERSLAQSTVSQVLGTPIQNVFVDNCGNYDYIEYKGDDQTLIYWYSNKYHFTTAGLWSEAANWQDGIVPYSNVDEIYIEAACQLDQDANVGTLTVTDGTLTLQSGKTLTVNAVLTNTVAEALVIKDGAQLINTSANVAATVEKDITAYSTNNPDGWYLIASPLVGNTNATAVANMLDNNYDLYYYDEPTHYWINQEYVANNFTELTNGKGYLYANSEEVTLTFAGELQNGTAMVNVPLSYTANAGGLKGFNLVGNPFVHNVISYASVNVANGCYQINEAKDNLIVSEITETNPLKPAEGFFVKATGEGASVTFNPGRGITANRNGSIQLELLDNGKLIDRLILKKDGQGLEKLSLNNQRTKLFAMQDHREMAIVSCEGNEQPVNFKAAKNGTYTLTVNLENVELDYLHLIDNMTGADVDLLEMPTYTFTAKTTDYASRFRLVFSANGDANSANTDVPFAFVNNGNIIINGEGILQIVDAMGRVVISGDAKHCVSTTGMAPGVYVLRLINGGDVRTQKIVIQ